jgi:tRNA(Ile)-lysidine synthase
MPHAQGLVELLTAALAPELARHAPLAVAFSGGRDSTVLLHLLLAVRGADGLRALHVEHDLQAAAPAWARHCADQCAALGIPIKLLRVHVPRDSGQGLEAAARAARYMALGAALAPDEALLTAHHRGDQLETLLLHLRRGSGPDGLAGIPARGELAGRPVLRPLLAAEPAALADYARWAGLSWVEDPSNADPAIDRSFLRHEVLPQLLARWPDFARGAARSAELMTEAAGLLAAQAAADLAECAAEPGRDPAAGSLDLAACMALPGARLRLLLRRLCRELGLPLPPETTLRRGLPGLLAAGPDRNPRLVWRGAELRRYRERLYLLAAADPAPPPEGLVLVPGPALALGAPRGCLRLVPVATGGIAVPPGGLTVGWRRGGERLRPAGQAHHRPLKLLLQERGVVPWMRAQLPLLHAGGQLVAVADLWLADEALAPAGQPGFRPEWEGHAALG